MSERQPTSFPTTLSGEPDARELRTVWSLLDQIASEPLDSAETDFAWRSIRPSIRSEGIAWTGVLLRAAAFAGLLLAGTWSWYQVPVIHSAAVGEVATVDLPDGSRVTLNAGSRVWHRRGFSLFPGLDAEERAVRLEGEGFFDVTSADRTFRVEAAGARVTVLGTRFNVRAREEGDVEVQVSVEEGRVELAAARAAGRADGRLTLSAGEGGRLADASATPEALRLRPERIAVWREGGLAAVDETLSGILAELSLRYGHPVTLSPGVDGSARLNVYYRELGSVESVLADLATQQGLAYRQTADGWELF